METTANLRTVHDDDDEEEEGGGDYTGNFRSDGEDDECSGGGDSGTGDDGDGSVRSCGRKRAGRERGSVIFESKREFGSGTPPYPPVTTATAKKQATPFSVLDILAPAPLTQKNGGLSPPPPPPPGFGKTPSSVKRSSDVLETKLHGE